MRYAAKMQQAKFAPISLGAVSFLHEANLALLARSAACFGVQTMNVIGAMPEYAKMRAVSGSVHTYVKYNQFKTPSAFLKHIRENKIKLICIELAEHAKPINDFQFSLDGYGELCLFIGHEESGTPAEVMHHANDVIYIPMPGIGWCLNTTHAAAIVLYEAVKQLK